MIKNKKYGIVESRGYAIIKAVQAASYNDELNDDNAKAIQPSGHEVLKQKMPYKKQLHAPRAKALAMKNIYYPCMATACEVKNVTTLKKI